MSDSSQVSLGLGVAVTVICTAIMALYETRPPAWLAALMVLAIVAAFYGPVVVMEVRRG
jgi:hypothetical protein